MKIDSDLRAAVRSAVKIHNNALDVPWQERERMRKEAIRKVAEAPANKRRVAAAIAAIAKCRKELERHSKILESLGIDESLNHIRDSNAFKKSGGVIPEKDEPLDVDRIISDLAASEPAEARAILKKLNIKWS